MKFDDILIHVGEFGSYQRRMYVLVCIPAIFTAIQTMVPVFILDIPKHRCAISPNDTFNIQGESHARLVNASIPYVKEGGEFTLSSCLLYKSPMNDSAASNDTETCSRWVFDTSDFQTNVITEFNIVCDKRILRTHSNMALFAGSLVGAFAMGFLSDLIGRKITFFISVGLQAISAIVTPFSPNIYVFIVIRVVNALSSTSLFMIAFVLGLEMVGPSKRVLAGVGVQLFWSVGIFLLVAIAYAIRNWKTLQLVISVPSVLMFGFWWLIPESPRWLMSRGRKAEAESIIQKAAKTNGVELPADMFAQLTFDEGDQGKFTQLFTSRVIRHRTLVIFFNWFVVNIVYYGLGLNVQNLSGDIYLNYTISSAVETMSYVACVLLLDRVGRKLLHCTSMFVGGLACVAVLFPVIYLAPSWVTILLSMIGKFGASAAFAIIYVFSAELLPTVVRNSGVGASSTCGKIGGMLSPYIADLGLLIGGDLKVALPLIVFGGLSVAAGGLSLILPETLNTTLPETVEDAKVFGQSTSGTKYNMKSSDKTASGDIQLNCVQRNKHV
ncbi:organic cation transporter protein-like [Haliotis rufescens]|uniref:organic cation transporter protein-like n=1 Tax=Haliotis rufescens TaxID=6454 RepID=UPI00201EB4CF|nr:organic cation transporter protein-like [Haliotis rufescens]